MTRRFQFSLRAMIQATAALGLLIAFCGLGSTAKVAYMKLFLYPVLFLALLILFLLPAGAFAYKFVQCLLGRLPPNELADAEPIRFDRPLTSDEE